MNTENKIGLWAKQSKNGNTYYAGKIKINDKEYKLQLFKAENKKSEKSPDYTLFIRDSVISQENNKSGNIVPKNSEKTGKLEQSEDIYANFGNNINEITDNDLAF